MPRQTNAHNASSLQNTRNIEWEWVKKRVWGMKRESANNSNSIRTRRIFFFCLHILYLFLDCVAFFFSRTLFLYVFVIIWFFCVFYFLCRMSKRRQTNVIPFILYTQTLNFFFLQSPFLLCTCCISWMICSIRYSRISAIDHYTPYNIR